MAIREVSSASVGLPAFISDIAIPRLLVSSSFSKLSIKIRNSNDDKTPPCLTPFRI